MKACVIYKKEDLKFEEVPTPAINEPHEVKIKIQSVGICGSDQHYYKEGGIGSSIVLKEPMILGHEACGLVEEIGSEVSSVKVGDMVIIRPARPCFECEYCKKQQYTFCLNMRHAGSAATFPHTRGFMSEYTVVHEKQCRAVNKQMSPQVAAFGEPLGIAYSGINAIGNIIGKNIAVMGAGPIGCLCVAAAKTLGADQITVFDIRDEALQIAKQMGADFVVNTKKNPELVNKYTQNKGFFDCGVEASGNGIAASTLMSMIKPLGTISQVGMFALGKQPTDLGALSTKGLVWKGVFRFYDEFGACVNALENKLINPLPLLTKEFEAKDCVEAMKFATSGKAMKVQVKF